MSKEPKAVLVLLALVVAGHAGRLLIGRPGSAPGDILPVRASGTDAARQRARAERLGRPLRSGETVDVNSAPAEEIARLPRVGMSLAKRIVADRSERGPFRGPEDLDRVPGVGSALLATLHGKVDYGRLVPEVRTQPRDANLSSFGAYGAGLVDLNSASEADLMALPGVGRAKARAILAYRRDKGSFASVSELERVSGFGPALVARLTPRLAVR